MQIDNQLMSEIRDFLQDISAGADVTDASRDSATEFVALLPDDFSDTAAQGVTANGPYRARKSDFSESWNIERAYPCINGLSAWFQVAEVREADEWDVGYTEGAFGSGEERARQIANALNASLAEITPGSAILKQADELHDLGFEGGWNAAIEECAKMVEPKGERPCDCDGCYCHNNGDAAAVAAWDADAAMAKAIRLIAQHTSSRSPAERAPASCQNCHDSTDCANVPICNAVAEVCSPAASASNALSKAMEIVEMAASGDYAPEYVTACAKSLMGRVEPWPEAPSLSQPGCANLDDVLFTFSDAYENAKATNHPDGSVRMGIRAIGDKFNFFEK
jgi:hypothetical protein